LAVIFGNGVLIPAAGMLQLMFRNLKAFTWSLVFYGMAALFIAIWLYHAYIMPRSAADQRHNTNASEVASGIVTAFRTFFQKLPPKEMIFAMLFLLFYRFPEALLGKMSVTFLMRPNSAGGLGLSPQEFGLASGTIGVIGLTLGGILGGLLAGRDGFKRWLWPMVCAITLPDIVYVYMSYAMPDNLVLISTCIFIEQFGYGLGFTALTLYMLYFSKGEFQTSHYAFCTAFSYLGLMLPGMLSGWLKDQLGYNSFFILVMFLCAITFAVTAFIKVDPDFGKKTPSDAQ
jgi:PAT family beta-lactamase induction signal transducer AmpG